MPVPERETVEVCTCASLAIATEPVNAPADLGAKVTCRASDWPAGTVAGTATPLAVNPVPLTATCEMVKSLLPEFLSMTAWVLVPFTRTLPYVRLVALKESCEAVLPALPLSLTLVEPPPCEVIAVSSPETLPTVEVLNATRNCADWPGASVNGMARPEVENSADDELNCVMRTALLPVLVRVADCVACCPTFTFGNVNVAGVI